MQGCVEQKQSPCGAARKTHLAGRTEALRWFAPAGAAAPPRPAPPRWPRPEPPGADMSRAAGSMRSAAAAGRSAGRVEQVRCERGDCAGSDRGREGSLGEWGHLEPGFVARCEGTHSRVLLPRVAALRNAPSSPFAGRGRPVRGAERGELCPVTARRGVRQLAALGGLGAFARVRCLPLAVVSQPGAVPAPYAAAAPGSSVGSDAVA